MSAPFSLSAVASVYGKVVPYNSIGDSIESAVGNGAILMLSLKLDAPILTQNLESTTKT